MTRQVLVGLLFLINVVQYVFFLSADLSRPAMQAYTQLKWDLAPLPPNNPLILHEMVLYFL